MELEREDGCERWGRNSNSILPGAQTTLLFHSSNQSIRNPVGTTYFSHSHYCLRVRSTIISHLDWFNGSLTAFALLPSILNTASTEMLLKHKPDHIAPAPIPFGSSSPYSGLKVWQDLVPYYLSDISSVYLPTLSFCSSPIDLTF